MIIDLRNCKQKGLYEGSFEFEYEPDNALLPFSDGSFGSKATISGNYEIDGRDVYVTGTVSFVLSSYCARCGEPCESKVTLDFDEKFVSENSDEFYTYAKDSIVLKKLVDDLIISQTPLCIYCKPDCKGLCPICGTNLNKSKCECENNL